MRSRKAFGASAVRCGTRFLAAQECDTHPDYLRALAGATAADTVITETFSVMWPNAPHRVLRSCVEAAEAFQGDVTGEMRAGEGTMAIPHFSTPAPTRETTGAISAMALYAGESVGAVSRVQPAGEIVREMADEAERLLRAGWNEPAPA